MLFPAHAGVISCVKLELTRVKHVPRTRGEVVIRKFRTTAADVLLPAHAGVIFGWEYYPFPPN